MPNMPILEYNRYPDLPQYILHANDKRPIDVNGKNIDAHDSNNWMTYDEAHAAATMSTFAAGVGFVLTKSDPFFVIDIDKAIDPATGQWDERVHKWTALMPGCGVEVSRSGKGVHFWGVASPDIADRYMNRDGEIEFYFSDRYIALGSGMQGDIDLDFSEVLREKLTPHTVATGAALPASGPVADSTPITDDTLLIQAALQARGSAAAAFGDKAGFDDLWNANGEVLAKHFPTDTDDTFDRSAADASLLSHLAFWTGRDQARMTRLWLESPLALDRAANAPTKQKREKLTKHSNYLQDTVAGAADTCSKVYTGGAGVAAPNDAQRRLINLGTHHDMAVAFVDAHKGDVLHDSDRGFWFHWCESHFEVVGAGEIQQAVRLFCDQAGEHAAKTPRSLNFIKSVTELVSIDYEVARRTSIFDNDEFKLNTPNGTVDLRTGEIRPHTRGDYITKCTAAGPAASADGSRFSTFIDEVTCGDKDLAVYLQTMIGPCLSGAISNHWFGFLFGGGRNGKSVLLDTLAHVFGDYAVNAPSSLFMASQFQDHKEGVARLKGARLVISSEVDSAAHFADSTIKDLCGNETLTARHMRQSTFEFRRTFKILIAGNHKPQLRSADTAFRSRLKLIPFNADFADTADPDLPRVLRSEAGAILRWLVDGHSMWISQGQKLGTCSAVEAEADDYFANQLSVREWADERLKWIEDDRRAITAWPVSQNLYSDYKSWIVDRGGKPITMPRWANDMKSIGFVNAKSGNAHWRHCVRVADMPPVLPGLPIPTIAVDNTKLGRSDV